MSSVPVVSVVQAVNPSPCGGSVCRCTSSCAFRLFRLSLVNGLVCSHLALQHPVPSTPVEDRQSSPIVAGPFDLARARAHVTYLRQPQDCCGLPGRRAVWEGAVVVNTPFVGPTWPLSAQVIPHRTSDTDTHGFGHHNDFRLRQFGRRLRTAAVAVPSLTACYVAA